jgi:hypothetical protein
MSNEYFLTQFLCQISDIESVSYLATAMAADNRPQYVRPGCNATPVG